MNYFQSILIALLNRFSFIFFHFFTGKLYFAFGATGIIATSYQHDCINAIYVFDKSNVHQREISHENHSF
jgi:hypothetical protein